VKDIHGPLDQRAWYLQERLMSRALLHFRVGGMAWECSTQTIFESGVFGKAAHPDLEALFKQHLSQPLQPSLPVPQHAIYKTWSELIRLYTSRKLTFDKDRLIAAAGLAQSFRTVHPGEISCRHLERKFTMWPSVTSGPSLSKRGSVRQPRRATQVANAFLELGGNPAWRLLRVQDPGSGL
jgi:hypothetical protein